MLGRNNKVGPEQDIENNNNDDELLPVTNHGRYVPSRFGKTIRCRQWRALDGNFRFLFDGRLIYGPGTAFFWIFIVLHIVASCIVFLIYESTIFRNEEWKTIDWFAIIAIIAAIGSMYNILRIVFTEPGCIPKKNVAERLHNLVQYHFKKQPGASNIEQIMEYNGAEQLCTFCDKCCHFKPKRSEHCDICGFCIDRKVHHCSIFGICIGRRNYRYFYLFLIFVNVLFAVTLPISIMHLVSLSEAIGFYEAIKLAPTVHVLSIGLICPPFGIIQMFLLLIQHFFLIIADLTYADYMSYGYCFRIKEIGCFGAICWMAHNFYKLILCAPPKTLLGLRNYVTLEVNNRRQSPAAKNRAGYSFWVCGLNTAAAAIVTAPRRGNSEELISSTKMTPNANGAASPNPNPLIDDNSPKTRGVYTLPSPDSTQTKPNPKVQSRFEALRLQIVQNYPQTRNEAAEPAPTRAQLRMQQELRQTQGPNDPPFQFPDHI